MIDNLDKYRIDDGFYKCPKCNRKFSRLGLQRHIEYENKTRVIWNKDLNKKDYPGLIKISKKNIKGIFKGKKHSQEVKNIISEKRKIWLKNNRDKHNWRFKKESYPEKLMREWLEKNFNEYIIVSEYTPKNFKKNYKMDFAFLNEKICIEVNGEQHYYRNGNLKEYYKQRQNYIESFGWKVINIKAVLIIKNFNEVKLTLNTIKNIFDKSINEKINKIKTMKQISFEKCEKNKEKIIELFFNGYTIGFIQEFFNNEYIHMYIKDVLKLKRDCRLVKSEINKEKIKNRISDLKNIEKIENMTIEKLSKKWEISHTQVRRFIKQYCSRLNYSVRNNAEVAK